MAECYRIEWINTINTIQLLNNPLKYRPDNTERDLQFISIYCAITTIKTGIQWKWELNHCWLSWLCNHAQAHDNQQSFNSDFHVYNIVFLFRLLLLLLHNKLKLKICFRVIHTRPLGYRLRHYNSERLKKFNAAICFLSFAFSHKQVFLQF